MAVLSQAHVLVLNQLLALSIPVLLVYGTFIILNRQVNSSVSTWILVPSAVFVTLTSLPMFLAVRARILHWHNVRKAARLGAVLPPKWEGQSIGNFDILSLLLNSHRNGFLSDWLWEKMHDLGSTYSVSILWEAEYCTSDVNSIKTILVTDFNNWVKGEKFDSFVNSVLGKGVFNSDGDLWRFHRSMTRPFFTRDRISHFELFDKHAEHVLKKMKDRFDSGYAVDFQDLIYRFTLDSATEFLFGSCVNSLHSMLPYPHNAPLALRNSSPSPADQFASAFADAQMALYNRSTAGWVWPWTEIFGSKTAPAMRTVNSFLDPILQDALTKAKATEDAPGSQIGEGDTLLDHLVRSTTDLSVLHDEVLNIMIAGRDTTAGMLTVTVYFLSQHPSVLQRLRKEILRTVGTSRRPTFDDIRDMKYLRAVLNESMRLYPAVPWNVRYAVNDTVLPSPDPMGKPLFVPAGTSVSYSVHCMHRRTDYWGPDAEEFDPDRFLDHRVQKYLIPNPFIFLPFNAGPRICLGQQFAYNEMSFFLVRLLQKFATITLDVDAQPPATRPPAEWANFPGRKGIERFWPKAHLTLYAFGGLWLRMGEADTEHQDL